jgi:hypothetical protein
MAAGLLGAPGGSRTLKELGHGGWDAMHGARVHRD